ncbi:hypothetical protein [Neisseria animaloris]|nr:hypothetical protein [Neisseria animaloris]
MLKYTGKILCVIGLIFLWGCQTKHAPRPNQELAALRAMPAPTAQSLINP